MSATDLTRFYFHIRDGVFIEDPDGSLLPDLPAARQFAILSARDLWARALRVGQDPSEMMIEITDEQGICLASIALTDALPDSLRARVVG